MSERKWLVLGVALITAAVLVFGARYTRRVGEQLSQAPAGEKITLRFFRDPKPVQPFRATTLDGRGISTDDWRGKVTLVNFWATWCPPCRAEIPDLVKLQEKYGERLQIVGVSVDEAGVDVVKAFAAEQRVNYPVVMITPEIEKVFGSIYALPTTFVVDPEGRIVQKHVGMLNAALTEAETRALAGLEPAAAVERIDPNAPVQLTGDAQATDIPGIDLSALTPAQKTAVLQRLNADPCTCGCGLTLAQCRIDDPSCGVSLPLARQVLDEVSINK